MKIVRYVALNIPAFVLMIMIACCAIADVAVCHKPRMLWTAVPITVIMIVYLNKHPTRGSTGKPDV